MIGSGPGDYTFKVDQDYEFKIIYGLMPSAASADPSLMSVSPGNSLSTNYGHLSFKGLNYAVDEEQVVDALVGEFDINTN